MTFEVRRVIGVDHPALAGHFPGNPIVPGTLLLDEVMQAVEECLGRRGLSSVVSAKFTSPLKAGEAFAIRLREVGDSHIDFECSLAARVLATGRLAVEPGPDTP